MTKRIGFTGAVLLLISMFTGVAGARERSIVREGGSLRLTATGEWSALRLVVVGNGRRMTQSLKPSVAVPLPVADAEGKPLPDGVYRYEAVLVPAARARKAQRFTGSYRIAFGYVVTSEPEEPEAQGKGTRANVTLTTQDACIGPSCTESETYGIEPLKIKSGHPWLKLEDASTALGAPTDDWTIIANLDSLNRFTIWNNTLDLMPFTIEAGAHDDTLWLSAQGFVGIGTTVPESELHIMGADPKLTLESTNAAWYWSLGATSDLSISDYSGNVPVVITGGAPDDSLVVAGSGDVGVGGHPVERLHVRENANANSFILIENNDPGTAAAGVLRAKSNSAAVNFQAHGNGRTISRFGVPLASWTEFLSVQGNGLAIGTFNAAPLVLGTSSVARINITAAGNVGVGTASPAHPLQMASGAHVTAGGVWTNASSRTLKENIEEISADEAAAALDALEPVTFSYSAEAGETYAGFIAEDVPELVAMKDRASLSAMDVVAVLTRVVKDERARVAEQQAVIERLVAMNEAALRRLEVQSSRIEELAEKVRKFEVER